MENEMLNKYITKVYSFPFLSGKEQNELIKQIKKNGNELAKTKLINAHLRIVVKIARQYYNFFNIDQWDLIQAGNIGLIQAIPKFIPKKGKTFSNYSSYRIKAAILYLLKKEEFPIIRYKDKRIDLFRRFKKVKKIIIRDNEGSFSLEKAAGMMGMPVKKLKNLLYDVYQIRCISENTPINDSSKPITIRDSISVKNILNPELNLEENIQEKDLWEKTREILSYLTPREEKVLRMRFGIGEKYDHTLEETGQLLKVTREAIRQTEAKALRKLRQKFTTGTKKFKLSDYL